MTQVLSNTLYTTTAVVSIFFILLSRWMQGEPIELATTYSVFSLIFVLCLTVNSLTFIGTIALSSLQAILNRYGQVMGLAEKETVTTSAKSDSPVHVKLEGCSFAWQKEPIITNLSVELASSELMIVIGAVGCGKTTLLHSLMHETVRTEGQHSQKGTTAYVEQEPFIFSASIKENILLGLPLDENRL